MKTDPLEPRRRGSALFRLGGVVIVVAAFVLLGGLVWKQKARVQAEKQKLQVSAEAGPAAHVVSTTRTPATKRVELVGEARPFANVTLYAKISGYLREIKVDKGDPVTQGQILAIIDSPELDSQYEAAAADARNKRAEAKRNWKLLPQGGASQQTAEAAEAAAQVAEAYAAALLSQKDYETLHAPFRGTVTARYADPGALIQSAVNAQTTALPVVALSQTDRLRVYVYLDQKNANLVQVGDGAEISDTARPEVKLPATVSRTSGELDPKTRTLLTELDVANGEGRMVAGSFVKVTLTLRNPPGVQVPAEALAIRGETTTVGVLTDQNRVNFRPVTIAESDGRVVKVSAGLTEGEKVVLNPGKGIAEGDQVQPIDRTGE